MAIKNVFIFGLLAGLLVIGGCKKTCTFPEREDGKDCWEVRNDLIGIYYGTKHAYNPDNAQGVSNQQIIQEVGSYSDDKTGIKVGGVKGTFDDSLHITFPLQQTYLSANSPHHVSGTGLFTDTVLYGKPNKMLSLNLYFTSDTLIPGNTMDHFVFLFNGLR